MKIGVVKERAPNERRVALVPDALKPLLAAGAEVVVERGAGEGAAIPDSLYTDAGATVASRDDVYSKADVIVRVQKPADNDVESLRDGQIVVGLLQPLIDPKLMATLAGKKVTAISLDAIPRTLSRAQSMDVLSSQANVGGYRAVLMAAEISRFSPQPRAQPGRRTSSFWASVSPASRRSPRRAGWAPSSRHTTSDRRPRSRPSRSVRSSSS
jgi:NAD(P) transhydrogenase subunit alpha